MEKEIKTKEIVENQEQEVKTEEIKNDKKEKADNKPAFDENQQKYLDEVLIPRITSRYIKKNEKLEDTLEELQKQLNELKSKKELESLNQQKENVKEKDNKENNKVDEKEINKEEDDRFKSLEEKLNLLIEENNKLKQEREKEQQEQLFNSVVAEVETQLGKKVPTLVKKYIRVKGDRNELLEKIKKETEEYYNDFEELAKEHGYKQVKEVKTNKIDISTSHSDEATSLEKQLEEARKSGNTVRAIVLERKLKSIKGI